MPLIIAPQCPNVSIFEICEKDATNMLSFCLCELNVALRTPLFLISSFRKRTQIIRYNAHYVRDKALHALFGNGWSYSGSSESRNKAQEIKVCNVKLLHRTFCVEIKMQFLLASGA